MTPPRPSDEFPRGLAMSRLVSFLVLVAILVVIAVVFVRVMAGFFVPLCKQTMHFAFLEKRIA